MVRQTGVSHVGRTLRETKGRGAEVRCRGPSKRQDVAPQVRSSEGPMRVPEREVNGRFASKVGFPSELESTRNVGNQRCCNMQNNNSQHLYTRFIRRIAGASESILCSLLACTVLRMESRLLLPRGSCQPGMGLSEVRGAVFPSQQGGIPNLR